MEKKVQHVARLAITVLHAGCFCYQYGDLIQTMDDTQQQGFFRLPASAAAANCLDTNPAGTTARPPLLHFECMVKLGKYSDGKNV